MRMPVDSADATQLARFGFPLLLLGERAGTEALARRIHEASPRRPYRFLSLDCRRAAVARELRLAAARGEQGTLLLERVDALPTAAQTYLLELVRHHRRLRAGRGPALADVRVLATTSTNLHQAVAAGRFRADLFACLSAFTLLARAGGETFRLHRAGGQRPARLGGCGGRQVQRQRPAELRGGGVLLAGGELGHAEMEMVQR